MRQQLKLTVDLIDRPVTIECKHKKSCRIRGIKFSPERHFIFTMPNIWGLDGEDYVRRINTDFSGNVLNGKIFVDEDNIEIRIPGWFKRAAIGHFQNIVREIEMAYPSVGWELLL